MTTIMTTHGQPAHPDFDGEGDIVMSDGPQDLIATSPSTNPSSYASSRHEDTDNDMPTTTRTPRGSGAGLHNIPDKQAPPTKPELFTLPRELRERIYTYALSTSHTIPWPSLNLRTHLSPQLLRTCKMIYAEAAPVLYSQNRFQFTHPSDANMFLYSHNPHLIRQNVKKVCLVIKDHRDVRNLWTFWLSSTMATRSLATDYPNLTNLDVRLRSDLIRTLNGDLIDRYKRWLGDRALRDIDGALKETVVKGCAVTIVAHTKLATADLKVLVEAFPEGSSPSSEALRRAQHRERGIVFRSGVLPMEMCEVALEIEASEHTRVVGP
ncbi:hypothetical protein EG328_010639 [Venturia inaequalis]|uniref:DUF7730 domain-containing protein n=1 Tax=Venturia inaequalis TaxID=5025 RepID=A0A8H3V683_VENIN|nr:hypothetical protein EG328_010639 [Venturia inaequalis]